MKKWWDSLSVNVRDGIQILIGFCGIVMAIGFAIVVIGTACKIVSLMF